MSMLTCKQNMTSLSLLTCRSVSSNTYMNTNINNENNILSISWPCRFFYIRWHFIMVYTVCLGTKRSSDQMLQQCFYYNLTPLYMYNRLSSFIVPNKKEDFLHRVKGYNKSHDMRFPTMWYLWLAKSLIRLRICAGWSETLLVAWIFYECKCYWLNTIWSF